MPFMTDLFFTGCCRNIRVASSHIQSMALQNYGDKLGLYNAVGHMNQRLVYQQITGTNVAYTWQDQQGILRYVLEASLVVAPVGP